MKSPNLQGVMSHAVGFKSPRRLFLSITYQGTYQRIAEKEARRDRAFPPCAAPSRRETGDKGPYVILRHGGAARLSGERLDLPKGGVP